MKKKLLITLGCSFTEGEGAYDLTKDYTEKDRNGLFITRHRDRFHQYGWPAFLQKKLKYDTLINLGFIGASNSQISKRFFEVFNDSKLSEEYDVLVIWMVTLPQRISFYSNYKIESVSHGSTTDYSKKTIYNMYLKFIKDVDIDPLLDTMFYIKTVQAACKAYNFNFLYTMPLYENLQELTKNMNFLYPNKNFLNLYYKIFNNHTEGIFPYSSDTFYKSPVCSHPNEHGYKYISDNIFKIIEQFFPEYINIDYEPTIYENIYQGEPKYWYIPRNHNV